jgi:hypothetical protein
METIKHILGFCGESHINIFTVILLIALVKFVFDMFSFSKFKLKK